MRISVASGSAQREPVPCAVILAGDAAVLAMAARPGRFPISIEVAQEPIVAWIGQDGHLQDKGRITWENIELRVDLAEGHRQLIRPDVYSLAATYNEKNLAPCVHEVKVSRSDFLSDAAKFEKRSGYAAVAESVFYVAPAGLIEPAEVPDECGLIVEHETGVFEQVKRAKKRAVRLAPSTFMNLVLKPGAVRPLI